LAGVKNYAAARPRRARRPIGHKAHKERFVWARRSQRTARFLGDLCDL